MLDKLWQWLSNLWTTNLGTWLRQEYWDEIEACCKITPLFTVISSAYFVYIGHTNFAIIESADGLAPHGARPSAILVMTTRLIMLPLKFLWLSKN